MKGKRLQNSVADLLGNTVLRQRDHVIILGAHIRFRRQFSAQEIVIGGPECVNIRTGCRVSADLFERGETFFLDNNGAHAANIIIFFLDPGRRVLGSTEIQQDRISIFVDKDIVRSDIAVQDAVLVDLRKHRKDRIQQRNQFRLGKFFSGLLADDLAQGLSLHIVHHKISCIVLPENTVNMDNI